MYVSGMTALEHCKGLLNYLERCDMLGRFVVKAGMTVVRRRIVVEFTVLSTVFTDEFHTMRSHCLSGKTHDCIVGFWRSHVAKHSRESGVQSVE
jgi:hypothetical protein